MAEKIVQSLYNGEVEITFSPGNHTYRKEGKVVPSVTSVTGIIDKSTPLLIWASRLCHDFLIERYDDINGKEVYADIVKEAVSQHRIKKEEAADIGTQVHQWIENYIKGVDQPMPADEKVKGGIVAFLDWKKEHQVKFIQSERFVYSKSQNYCGLLDLLAEIDGKMTIVDFKTSNNIYPDHFLQVAAYRGAYQEETGLSSQKCKSIIAHFSKDTGDFKVYEQTEFEKDYVGFAGALALRNRVKELDKELRA